MSTSQFSPQLLALLRKVGPCLICADTESAKGFFLAYCDYYAKRQHSFIYELLTYINEVVVQDNRILLAHLHGVPMLQFRRFVIESLFFDLTQIVCKFHLPDPRVFDLAALNSGEITNDDILNNNPHQSPNITHQNEKISSTIDIRVTVEDTRRMRIHLRNLFATTPQYKQPTRQIQEYLISLIQNDEHSLTNPFTLYNNPLSHQNRRLKDIPAKMLAVDTVSNPLSGNTTTVHLTSHSLNLTSQNIDNIKTTMDRHQTHQRQAKLKFFLQNLTHLHVPHIANHLLHYDQRYNPPPSLSALLPENALNSATSKDLQILPKPNIQLPITSFLDLFYRIPNWMTTQYIHNANNNIFSPAEYDDLVNILAAKAGQGNYSVYTNSGNIFATATMLFQNFIESIFNFHKDLYQNVVYTKIQLDFRAQVQNGDKTRSNTDEMSDNTDPPSNPSEADTVISQVPTEDELIESTRCMGCMREWMLMHKTNSWMYEDLYLTATFQRYKIAQDHCYGFFNQCNKYLNIHPRDFQQYADKLAQNLTLLHLQIAEKLQLSKNTPKPDMDDGENDGVNAFNSVTKDCTDVSPEDYAFAAHRTPVEYCGNIISSFLYPLVTKQYNHAKITATLMSDLTVLSASPAVSRILPEFTQFVTFFIHEFTSKILTRHNIALHTCGHLLYGIVFSTTDSKSIITEEDEEEGRTTAVLDQCPPYFKQYIISQNPIHEKQRNILNNTNSTQNSDDLTDLYPCWDIPAFNNPKDTGDGGAYPIYGVGQAPETFIMPTFDGNLAPAPFPPQATQAPPQQSQPHQQQPQPSKQKEKSIAIPSVILTQTIQNSIQYTPNIPAQPHEQGEIPKPLYLEEFLFGYQQRMMHFKATLGLYTHYPTPYSIHQFFSILNTTQNIFHQLSPDTTTPALRTVMGNFVHQKTHILTSLNKYLKVLAPHQVLTTFLQLQTAVDSDKKGSNRNVPPRNGNASGKSPDSEVLKAQCISLYNALSHPIDTAQSRGKKAKHSSLDPYKSTGESSFKKLLSSLSSPLVTTDAMFLTMLYFTYHRNYLLHYEEQFHTYYQKYCRNPPDPNATQSGNDIQVVQLQFNTGSLPPTTAVMNPNLPTLQQFALPLTANDCKSTLNNPLIRDYIAATDAIQNNATISPCGTKNLHNHLLWTSTPNSFLEPYYQFQIKSVLTKLKNVNPSSLIHSFLYDFESLSLCNYKFNLFLTASEPYMGAFPKQLSHNIEEICCISENPGEESGEEGVISKQPNFYQQLKKTPPTITNKQELFNKYNDVIQNALLLHVVEQPIIYIDFDSLIKTLLSSTSLHENKNGSFFMKFFYLRGTYPLSIQLNNNVPGGKSLTFNNIIPSLLFQQNELNSISYDFTQHFLHILAVWYYLLNIKYWYIVNGYYYYVEAPNITDSSLSSSTHNAQNQVPLLVQRESLEEMHKSIVPINNITIDPVNVQHYDFPQGPTVSKDAYTAYQTELNRKVKEVASYNTNLTNQALLLNHQNASYNSNLDIDTTISQGTFISRPVVPPFTKLCYSLTSVPSLTSFTHLSDFLRWNQSTKLVSPYQLAYQEHNNTNIPEYDTKSQKSSKNNGNRIIPVDIYSEVVGDYSCEEDCDYQEGDYPQISVTPYYYNPILNIVKQSNTPSSAIAPVNNTDSEDTAGFNHDTFTFSQYVQTHMTYFNSFEQVRNSIITSPSHLNSPHAVSKLDWITTQSDYSKKLKERNNPLHATKIKESLLLKCKLQTNASNSLPDDLKPQITLTSTPIDTQSSSEKAEKVPLHYKEYIDVMNNVFFGHLHQKLDYILQATMNDPNTNTATAIVEFKHEAKLYSTLVTHLHILLGFYSTTTNKPVQATTTTTSAFTAQASNSTQAANNHTSHDEWNLFLHSIAQPTKVQQTLHNLHHPYNSFPFAPAKAGPASTIKSTTSIDQPIVNNTIRLFSTDIIPIMATKLLLLTPPSFTRPTTPQNTSSASMAASATASLSFLDLFNATHFMSTSLSTSSTNTSADYLNIMCDLYPKIVNWAKHYSHVVDTSLDISLGTNAFDGVQQSRSIAKTKEFSETYLILNTISELLFKSCIVQYSESLSLFCGGDMPVPPQQQQHQQPSQQHPLPPIQSVKDANTCIIDTQCMRNIVLYPYTTKTTTISSLVDSVDNTHPLSYPHFTSNIDLIFGSHFDNNSYIQTINVQHKSPHELHQSYVSYMSQLKQLATAFAALNPDVNTRVGPPLYPCLFMLTDSIFIAPQTSPYSTTLPASHGLMPPLKLSIVHHMYKDALHQQLLQRFYYVLSKDQHVIGKLHRTIVLTDNIVLLFAIARLRQPSFKPQQIRDMMEKSQQSSHQQQHSLHNRSPAHLMLPYAHILNDTYHYNLFFMDQPNYFQPLPLNTLYNVRPKQYDGSRAPTTTNCHISPITRQYNYQYSLTDHYPQPEPVISHTGVQKVGFMRVPHCFHLIDEPDEVRSKIIQPLYLDHSIVECDMMYALHTQQFASDLTSMHEEKDRVNKPQTRMGNTNGVTTRSQAVLVNEMQYPKPGEKPRPTQMDPNTVPTLNSVITRGFLGRFSYGFDEM